MNKLIEYVGDTCNREKQTAVEKDCRDKWTGGCGGNRRIGSTWVHVEGDTGAESYVDSKTL